MSAPKLRVNLSFKQFPELRALAQKAQREDAQRAERAKAREKAREPPVRPTKDPWGLIWARLGIRDAPQGGPSILPRPPGALLDEVVGALKAHYAPPPAGATKGPTPWAGPKPVSEGASPARATPAPFNHQGAEDDDSQEDHWTKVYLEAWVGRFELGDNKYNFNLLLEDPHWHTLAGQLSSQVLERLDLLDWPPAAWALWAAGKILGGDHPPGTAGDTPGGWVRITLVLGFPTRAQLQAIL